MKNAIGLFSRLGCRLRGFGDDARTRTEGSTGLGLSIVHAVVTAHHGTVSVESEPGNTRFTVRLPIEPRGRLASPEAAGA